MKISEYRQMMAYLTRPGFKDGKTPKDFNRNPTGKNQYTPN